MNIYESRFGNFARKIELSSTMLYVIGSLARKGQTSVTHREMYILQNVTLMTSTRRGATPEEAYLKSDIICGGERMGTNLEGIGGRRHVDRQQDITHQHTSLRL